MLHIDIICVGKIREQYLKDAIAEYAKRLSKYCILNVIELNDEKLPTKLNDSLTMEVKKKESNSILSHIKKDSYVIALDLKGKNYTSEEFSTKIENISITNSTISFLIGGTLGMTESLLNQTNELICFSKMTFPHPLIRVFLLEQLFRAFKISNGENYHH
ncbi:MAG: 23S rRNA (pseudouridine(1915)-N(3))-methyltransferase RlmH [Clostridiaceae bacterium]|nr:23S rRNA (pseudouridine(1915)-N(3))-methyltransferase RlmH [Clostridiaceae bacterium]